MHINHVLSQNILRSGLTIATTLILGACAPLGPQVQLNEPITAEQLQLPEGSTATVISQWWRQLDDPVLNQLVDKALNQSLDLKIAYARLSQSQAQVAAVSGAAGIQVGAAASGNGFYIDPKPDLNTLASSIPPSPSMNSVGLAVGAAAQKTTHYIGHASLSLQAKYAFDFWGKYSNSIQAALGQQRAAQLQIEQAKLLLAQAVIAQYLTWQELHEQTKIIQQRIQNSQYILDLVKKRVHTQLLPENAAYPLEQALNQLESKLSNLLIQQAKIRHSLAVLLGQPPSSFDTLKPSSLSAFPVVVDIHGLRADILGQRPDIAAQKELITSRWHGVAVAKAEFYPNIEIKGMAGLSHIDALNLLHGDSRLLGIMPAISLPIFTSGQLQANLSAKNAQYNEQVAQYDKTVMTALQQAADAIVAYENSNHILAQQRHNWILAQKAADSSMRRLKAGLDNGITSGQQQDKALAAQMDYIAAQILQQQSWNALQAALGGGFHE